MPVRKDQEMLHTMLSTPIQQSQAKPAMLEQAPAQAAEAQTTPALRIPVPAGPTPIPPPTAVRGIYRRLGTTLALCGAAVVGGLIWYFGGIFTLDFLSETFRDVAQFIRTAPWWQTWLIPLAISAMELFLWPRRERRPVIFLIRLVLWLTILAFDVFTTARGMLPMIQSIESPGLIDATQRIWLDRGSASVIGIAFAYLPERIARWVLTDLWALWLAPVWRWVKQVLDSGQSGA